jgi:hypothetical protein
VAELMQRCWDTAPEKRPTFLEIEQFWEEQDIVPETLRDVPVLPASKVRSLPTICLSETKLKFKAVSG